MVAHVLIERKAKALDTTFTYLVPDNLTYEVAVGKRVIVPFGRQKLEGFILKLQDEVDTTYKLKPLEKVIDEEPVLNAEMLELGKYISQKTLASLSSVYQTMLPSALKAHYGFDVKKKYVTYLIPNLNLDGNILKGKQLEVWNYINGKKTLKTKATAISYDAVKALIKKGYLKEAKEEDYRLAPTSLNNTTKKTLTLDQKSVIKEVKNSFNQFKLFLLHGVTGSGKTEVYMNLIESVLKSGKEAIVLVPEISLTPQLIGQFQSRFGHLVAALHSGLSAGEKYDEWRKITRKEVKIVVGARSAIFAPFENLGLIVIDEEHSETYKQENNPKYHAIDVAIFRAKHYNIPLILGSATPSLESYTRAKLGVYKLLEMPNRINEMMPSISLIDMKEEIKKRNPVLSSALKEAINLRLANHEQVILLLNRRGYSTVVSCHNCGYVVKCPNCDIPLTFHKTSNTMRCHYCGYGMGKVVSCPNCKSKDINEFGMGTQKLEQVLKDTFKKAKIVRMDIDSTSQKGMHEKIIRAFQNHEYDILVGTQMIAKGLDFANVTLVGVINADSTLNVPDFRSAERSFELLSQVAGRSGRGSKKGEVIIQTFNPNHYSMQKVLKNDYQGFYEEEMKIRKEMAYPPYYNLLLISLSGRDLDNLLAEGKKITSYIKSKNLKDITILGPSAAFLPKVNNIYRVQIILKYKKLKEVYEPLKDIDDIYKNNSKINVEIDINPLRI